jgi:hypothetical protein
MDKKYLSPEKDLILRIIEQWGNAATMPEMEQWLKDYAAIAGATAEYFQKDKGQQGVINKDRVMANQVAGMPLEEAIFQDGYSSGYDAGYERGKREAQGAVWVKPENRLPEVNQYVLVEYYSVDFERKKYTGPKDWWIRNIKAWLDESVTTDYQQLKERYDDLQKQLEAQDANVEILLDKKQQLKQKAEKMEALINDLYNFYSDNWSKQSCKRVAEALNDQPKLSPSQIAERKEAIEWYRNPAGERQWKPAEVKPEHNVGVLVFIPGEDNHITSGMWDISNKWVLLDEYRTPEEEVTHWMPLPAFPEGYTWNEIPDDLVDAFKKVAKDELENRHKANDQPKGKEGDNG